MAGEYNKPAATPAPYFGKNIIFTRGAAYVWTTSTRNHFFIYRYRQNKAYYNLIIKNRIEYAILRLISLK